MGKHFTTIQHLLLHIVMCAASMLLCSMALALTLSRGTPVLLDGSAIFPGIVHDGSNVVVSYARQNNLYVRSYDSNFGALGAEKKLTSIGTVTDHKHIYFQNAHYLAYSTTGDASLYLIKLDNNLTQVGATVTVTAGSTNTKTNDMLLATDGTHIVTGEFRPGNLNNNQNSGHLIKSFDTSLNPVSSGTVVNVHKHINTASLLQVGGRMLIVAPSDFVPGGQVQTQRDLLLLRFDTSWSAVDSSAIKLVDSKTLTHSVNGDGIFMSTGLAYDANSNSLIVGHTFQDASSGNPDNGKIYLRVFDGTSFSQTYSEVMTPTSSSATRAHFLLQGDTLYVVYDDSSAGAPAVYGLKYTLAQTTAPVCTLSASSSSITAGASTTLTASCSPAATSYIWTGGSCSSTSATCTVTPTTTTTYTVTGSNTGGTSQAASVTVTVSAATSTTSYTVPGTLGNDFFVLTAGNTYYGGGGNDTYTISPSTLSGNVTAKIVDTEGDNIVQLVDGMTVSASTFYTDAAQLTLSNGAKVQILGASKFKFQLGANAPAGDTATAMTYTDFVTSLGASLTSGTLPVSGTAGYVVPTAFTQASAPAANLTTSASTVPGTLGNDVLVPSGGNNYLGGGGNDTYIISPYTLSGTVTAKIIDTEGANVIQLVGGLTIASSSFFNNAVQLTLSNGAIVQILGAASFSYQLGANAPAGQTTSSQTYAQFAATLGASVPTGTSAVSGSANYVVQGSTSGTSTAPTGVTVTSVLPQTVGTRTIASSTRLQVNWTAPTAGAVNHYRVDARESVGGSTTSTTALSSATGAEIGDLKAGTTYAITVTACDDSACSSGRGASSVNVTTNEEYWQLQGSGNTHAGLTRIVSDGNARISATRIGPDAGASTAARIQLYYGPMMQQGSTQPALSTATTTKATDAADQSSYTAFTSSNQTTGLITPATPATAVKSVATGQGVPLSVAMGGKIRLFFEAEGNDGKTRIYTIDSQDGYVGQDFNAGGATTCSTAADYSSGGGCVPTLAIGTESDDSSAYKKLPHARQHKVGFPTLDDWRWDGSAGSFMVFTTDSISNCSTSNMNHGYAVWDGSKWNVQYDSTTGCPKLFKSAQAAFPLHIGNLRYKLYYGDPSITTGKLDGVGMPFLGPKKLIYADGKFSGAADRVDFEDWEVQSSARNVNFLWPNGDLLDAAAEGYIDDYHFLAPTGNLNLQVMYMAITAGQDVPFGAAAVLLNP